MDEKDGIVPLPFFFHQVLLDESHTTSKVLWYFIVQSLERGVKVVQTSVHSLALSLNFAADSQAFNGISVCIERGYLRREEAGTYGQDRRVGVYSVAWDFFGSSDMEANLRRTWKFTRIKFSASSTLSDWMDETRDTGKKVLRVKKQVEQHGDKILVQTAILRRREVEPEEKSPLLISALHKIEAQNFSTLKPMELFRYWQHKYQSQFEVPYIGSPGLDVTRITKMLVEGVRREDLVLMTDWLCSSRTTFQDSPTINLLYSGYRQKIFEAATRAKKFTLQNKAPTGSLRRLVITQ